MEIHYGHRTEEELMREAAKERIFDAKSVILGVALFATLVVGASIWRLSVQYGSLTKLKDLDFTPEAPDTEEFELREPQRDLLREQMEEQPEEETPNIQMTTEIVETTIREEVIKTESIEVTTDVEVDLTEMDIIDAPEELVDLADETTYAITPIAALAPSPSSMFQYQKMTPRRQAYQSLLNRAPRPAEDLKLTPQQFGDLDAPVAGELGPVNISLLGSGEYLSGMGRSGLETRTAVDAALRWLALHQEADGYWSTHKWDDRDVSLEEAAAAEGKGAQHVRGISSFAILALMGGGHTIRRGEYRTHLLRALEWLMAQQDDKTGQLSRNMYEHAIGTIALCEAFGRAPDERIGLAARKATDFCVKARANDDGWRYVPNPPDGSDMSVTSWFLQALKTAKLAQIKFDHGVFSRGLAYVDQLTDRGGAKGSTGGVGYRYQPKLSYGRGSPALTCAAMVVRQFSGVGVNSPLLVSGAELTKANPPAWEGQKDFYYWYYATYAMHNMGGEYRIWWNRRIRDVLLNHQTKHGHQAGSWDPEGVKWGAGRVYTTALGALCLEVYYRYGDALQSFGIAPDLEDLFLQ